MLRQAHTWLARLLFAAWPDIAVVLEISEFMQEFLCDFYTRVLLKCESVWTRIVIRVDQPVLTSRVDTDSDTDLLRCNKRI